uniref:Paired domain-containing protein n=1 Tax=Acrobeloides nanus TaxID=290746 RepID=A0A914EJ12_9BILA
MSEFRPAIIRMHQNGTEKREISRLLSVPESTVRYAIKRFEETGSNHGRKGRGRKRTARAPRNIRRAKGMNQRNPSSNVNSKRKLAKKLGESATSAWRILREDLGLKPFKYLERQKLTDEAKKKRLDRARALLRRFSRGRHERDPRVSV